MVALRRPTTSRTSNVHVPWTALTYRRVGDARFPSLERTYVVRVRRAKDFVTVNKVAVGRGSNRSDSRHTGNPTGFSPGNIILHAFPGKGRQQFGPGLSRWGSAIGRGRR